MHLPLLQYIQYIQTEYEHPHFTVLSFDMAAPLNYLLFGSQDTFCNKSTDSTRQFAG